MQFQAAPVMFADERARASPPGTARPYGPCVLAAAQPGPRALASADPTAKPRIRHNYFADERDLETMVAGCGSASRSREQKALAPYTEGQFAPPASDSDEDLRDYVRQYAHSIFHPAGTCAMGAVVDERAAGQRAGGLRVVDASVMPTLVRGNPNAAVIAIAEKAADLIAGVAPLPRQAEAVAR